MITYYYGIRVGSLLGTRTLYVPDANCLTRDIKEECGRGKQRCDKKECVSNVHRTRTPRPKVCGGGGGEAFTAEAGQGGGEDADAGDAQADAAARSAGKTSHCV